MVQFCIHYIHLPFEKKMSNPIYKGGKSLAKGGKWVDPKAVVIVRIVAVCTHSH